LPPHAMHTCGPPADGRRIAAAPPVGTYGAGSTTSGFGGCLYPFLSRNLPVVSEGNSHVVFPRKGQKKYFFRVNKSINSVHKLWSPLFSFIWPGSLLPQFPQIWRRCGQSAQTQWKLFSKGMVQLAQVKLCQSSALDHSKRCFKGHVGACFGCSSFLVGMLLALSPGDGALCLSVHALLLLMFQCHTIDYLGFRSRSRRSRLVAYPPPLTAAFELVSLHAWCRPIYRSIDPSS